MQNYLSDLFDVVLLVYQSFTFSAGGSFFHHTTIVTHFIQQKYCTFAAMFVCNVGKFLMVSGLKNKSIYLIHHLTLRPNSERLSSREGFLPPSPSEIQELYMD
jgi:hypothetical protein